jgi:hypothetical protein
MENNDNGWNEWSRHVLRELERINQQVEKLHDEMSDLRQDLAIVRTELRLKAGIWGAIGAAIPVIVMLAFQLLKK